MKHFLFLAALICSSPPALGQVIPYPHPTINGIPVHCTDATGAVVYTELLPALNDLAQSTIEPSGMRVIRINLPLFEAQPPLIKLFAYAHECGHHMSGDIFMGVVFHEDDRNRELIADRIAIRILRDQLQITQQDADNIASTFRNNPPMFPYYLPGPLRGKWISDCYATTNNACTAPVAEPSDHPAPSSISHHADDSGSPTTLTFNEAIHKIMSASYTNFSDLRATSNGDYSDATIKVPYGGKQIDCSIHSGLSSELSCTLKLSDTEDDGRRDFALAKDKLATAVSAWTSNATKPMRLEYLDRAVLSWEAASSPDLEKRSFPRVMLTLESVKDTPEYVTIVTFQCIDCKTDSQ